MQGQMDLFNPPDMHIVNVCGELREAPSWMHYKRCENCSAWEMLENNKQPPEGCGIYGWDANPWVWVIEFERCEKPESL